MSDDVVWVWRGRRVAFKRVAFNPGRWFVLNQQRPGGRKVRAVLGRGKGNDADL